MTQTDSIGSPAKTRELHNHHFDWTIWNDLTFRDDDIVISTYAKAGTTWVQQMIAQMLFGGDPHLEVAEMSPWLDLRALKADMPGQMRRLADFLDIPIDARHWDAIVEHCSFDWMKANATKSVPLGGAFWDAGATVFINKGRNGVWKDGLADADSVRYEQIAASELGAECAHWLATGEISG